MAHPPQHKLTAFGQAALALDEELERFRELTEAAERIPLTTRRNLERAARLADEATESQQRLGTRMQEFIAALGASRERNEQCAQVMAQRRQEIEQRLGEVTALFRRLASLGESARTITQAIRTIGEGAGEEGPTPEVLVQLDEAQETLTIIVTAAGELATAAQDAGLAELFGEVDALRQQLNAARNKLNLLRKRLEEAAPTRDDLN
ncbi:MAG TPA: hypothetical protein VH877_14095 [Polyangia bacterium]|jgi:prefoldin subunit 5|nr:hypothetical protein [Polyangia bacterium]